MGVNTDNCIDHGAGGAESVKCVYCNCPIIIDSRTTVYPALGYNEFFVQCPTCSSKYLTQIEHTWIELVKRVDTTRFVVCATYGGTVQTGVFVEINKYKIGVWIHPCNLMMGLVGLAHSRYVVSVHGYDLKGVYQVEANIMNGTLSEDLFRGASTKYVNCFPRAHLDIPIDHADANTDVVQI